MSDQPTDQPTKPSADRPIDSPTLESTDVTAARLGISRNAVLQRIKRGTLSGQKVDGVWWVVLDDHCSDHATDRSTSRTTEQPTDRMYDRATDQRITSSGTARSQLEAIRDEWLAPLVAQITEQAEALGRLGAERDQARQSAEAAISKLDQMQEERDELLTVRETLRVRLSTLEAHQAESPTQPSSAPQTATDAATDTPWWAFWRRD